MEKTALCYGFNDQQLKNIITTISDTVFYNINGCEDIVIKDILDNMESYKNSILFNDKNDKIIMLVNFDNDNINNFLKQYPSKVPRPMFCTLTEHNIKWKFEQLKKDLIEEREYFRNRNKA